MVLWWEGSKGPTSTRWNERCFSDAGYDVEVKFKLNQNPKADLIFTPIPGIGPNCPVPVVTQFGGFGTQLYIPGKGFSNLATESLENSDLVILHDSNFHILMEEEGLDGKTVTVPNAVPPLSIPPKKSKNFTVLNPSGGSRLKEPGRFVEAAKIVGREESEIQFEMPIRSGRIWRAPIEWLKVENFKPLPTQPFEKMLDLYARADIVAPFSAAEIHPQTFYEACLAGKPLIEDQFGLIQSVHRDFLEEMIEDFGTESAEFHQRWKGDYESGEGNHYLKAESPEELAELVLELYADERRRAELGSEALKWINQFWRPKDRGERIIDCWRKSS